MSNLNVLYHQVEILSLQELESLKRFIEMRQHRLLADKLAESQASIDTLISRVQDSSSRRDLEAMFQHLQDQSVDPEDLKMFDWIKNLGDDEDAVAGAAG